jgi:hypothetical protein
MGTPITPRGRGRDPGRSARGPGSPIRLTCAAAIGTALQAVVTYDERMRSAAEALGMTVAAPA